MRNMDALKPQDIALTDAFEVSTQRVRRLTRRVLQVLETSTYLGLSRLERTLTDVIAAVVDPRNIVEVRADRDACDSRVAVSAVHSRRILVSDARQSSVDDDHRRLREGSPFSRLRNRDYGISDCGESVVPAVVGR